MNDIIMNILKVIMSPAGFVATAITIGAYAGYMKAVKEK